ncbi:hypothetical protein Lfu02_20820 [Longispora fulva]|uniref:Uncharacterized protein n=1 Tax=Longispora fulva TaxID=619741 RepID=A0A8J7GXL3_9ACTN|nr:hypothetical protein [Longispora fulva]MBG6139906.1 hypothetical protein [Longispora fulva]GIG57710.1 hypothetical protein Lfu02_20820 [Longispora fulva]
MTTETKLPTALYAAAGAADIAREKIEQIPAQAAKLSAKVREGNLKDKALDLGGRAAGDIAELGARAYVEISGLRRKVRKGQARDYLLSEAEKAREAAKRSADKLAERAQTTFEKLVERGTVVLEGEPTPEPVKAEATIDAAPHTSSAPKDPADAAEFIASAPAAPAASAPKTDAPKAEAPKAEAPKAPVKKVAKKAVKKATPPAE